jgi:hypothetical protein
MREWPVNFLAVTLFLFTITAAIAEVYDSQAGTAIAALINGIF